VAVDGDYAFRFWGFDDDTHRTDFLIGVGVLSLNQGVITGRHRSAAMPLQNGSPPVAGDHPVQLYPAAFTLEGKYELAQDGIWEADMLLKSVDPLQTLHATFAFVPAGADALWLISQSTELLVGGGKFVPVPEASMGEAVRLA
jgi:hypothetical protein